LPNKLSSFLGESIYFTTLLSGFKLSNFSKETIIQMYQKSNGNDSKAPFMWACVTFT